jgi:hypothetical protein
MLTRAECALPPLILEDIAGVIIDHIPEQDRWTVTACASVCTAFRVPAQKRRFRDLSLFMWPCNNIHDRLCALEEILNTNPVLGGYVSNLKLSIWDCPEPMDVILGQILRSMDRLQRLEVDYPSNEDSTSILNSPTFILELKRALNLPSLTEVIFPEGSCPPELLVSCTHVSRLKFSMPPYHVPIVPQASGCFKLKLKELEFLDTYNLSPVYELLVEGSNIRLPFLRDLRVWEVRYTSTIVRLQNILDHLAGSLEYLQVSMVNTRRGKSSRIAFTQILNNATDEPLPLLNLGSLKHLHTFSLSLNDDSTWMLEFLLTNLPSLERLQRLEIKTRIKEEDVIEDVRRAFRTFKNCDVVLYFRGNKKFVG